MPKPLQDAFTLLVHMRRQIFLAIAVFLSGALLGMVAVQVPDAMLDSLIELAQELKAKNWLAMTAFILFKNAVAAVVAVYSGCLLGILPFIAALTNGMLLGRAITLNPESAWLILPHGLFELPAIWIAWGMGFWCAGWIRYKPRLERLRYRTGASLHLIWVIVLPLLAIAAAIEATGIKLLTGG